MLRDRLAKAYSWAPTCNKALDVGCGNGTLARALADKVKIVYGIDVLPVCPDEGSSVSNVTLLVAQGEELPFTDGEFDLVTCLDTLEHVEDEARIVAEIYRVMKPGGTLIISVPHRGLFGWLDPDNLFFFPLSRIRRRLFRKVTDVYGIKHHIHYTLAELQKRLAGFETVRVYRSGLLFFPLFFFIAKVLDTIADYTWSGLRIIFKPIHWFCDQLIDLDYRIPAGPLAYCMILEAVKDEEANLVSSCNITSNKGVDVSEQWKQS